MGCLSKQTLFINQFQMTVCMLTCSVECTGLVHLQTRIAQHKKLQENLVSRFASERIVVVTHNGGQDFATRKAVKAIADSAQTKADWRDYGVESKFPLTAMATEALRERLRRFLRSASTSLHMNDDSCLERFGKDSKIMDVLTLLRDFRQRERQAGNGSVTVVILSGHAGGRGTTFRDDGHQFCLTDLFLSKDAHLSAELLVQIANRISGIFRDEHGAPVTPGRLNWWTTKEIHDSVKSHMNRLNELTETLRREDGKPLQHILKVSCMHVRALELTQVRTCVRARVRARVCD